MIATFSNPCTRCTNTLREYGEKKKKKNNTNQFCCARLAGSTILMKSNCIRWQIKAKSSFSGTRRCVMATNVYFLFSFYLRFSLFFKFAFAPKSTTHTANRLHFFFAILLQRKWKKKITHLNSLSFGRPRPHTLQHTSHDSWPLKIPDFKLMKRKRETTTNSARETK